MRYKVMLRLEKALKLHDSIELLLGVEDFFIQRQDIYRVFESPGEDRAEVLHVRHPSCPDGLGLVQDKLPQHIHTVLREGAVRIRAVIRGVIQKGGANQGGDSRCGSKGRCGSGHVIQSLIQKGGANQGGDSRRDSEGRCESGRVIQGVIQKGGANQSGDSRRDSKGRCESER
jgi:hypothetical protein